ncbi:MAG: phosphoribosyltransferase family protein [Candidatus Woesearchaeota archaeon]
MNALQETKIKLLAVDCLKAMKEKKTFRVLSKELSLPAGVLNRYINGYVLPKLERANQVIEIFSKNYLQKIINESSRREGSKYIVTSDILSQPFLLNIISYKVSRQFTEKIHKVFTAAVDGIPLALKVAEFVDARCIYAKKTQEIAFSDHYISKSRMEDKPLTSPFYLPKNLLKRNENVLIVDDVVRGGTTFDALLSICEQAKANIAGIFAIFMTGHAYRQVKKTYKVGYLFLVEG